MLIVDDQESVRVTLDYLLGLAGYRVLTAASGAEAIAIAERETVDGAIIDIHMPVMTGFDACERLRSLASAGNRSLKVWFMSGAVSREAKMRGSELGGLAVFSKPFDPEELTRRLEEDLSHSPDPSVLPARETTVDNADMVS